MDEKQAYIDTMINSFATIHTTRYWKEIIPALNLTSDSVVCELGCGHGLLLKELWNRFQPAKLIGIDLRSEMLEVARKNLHEVTGEVQLIQQHLQENQQLPVGLDLVISSRVMRSFVDQIGMLSSIYASLNKNGILVILDWALADLPTYEKYLRKNAYAIESSQDIVRFHRNFSRYSLIDWQWLLRACEFTIIKAFQLSPVHIVTIASKE